MRLELLLDQLKIVKIWFLIFFIAGWVMVNIAVIPIRGGPWELDVFVLGIGLMVAAIYFAVLLCSYSIHIRLAKQNKDKEVDK